MPVESVRSRFSVGVWVCWLALALTLLGWSQVAGICGGPNSFVGAAVLTITGAIVCGGTVSSIVLMFRGFASVEADSRFWARVSLCAAAFGAFCGAFFVYVGWVSAVEFWRT